ncbi:MULTISPECIES: enolase C-terminal domain-like protein [Streptomyces]|uniref:L-fuconate dehydratase n=1 Tax=Streptomyces glycanivorans TaxID=3033808 RepID=A0ABY9JIC9_9ACTN|nr:MULTISPECIES: enolase C-terminal domain-like protein [unclassified Streptomyces]WSQ80915.1 fuconate dehydratase [Streptomyces sp. NBC_01213]TXS10235.1 fuconate dehydratase [Streptomyces sp. wa22]WLQ67487.1 enolase C-terminal domain-like protein [Streptomyces sp. Alt3]WSQ88245.1 fuconate dehydratase [Streptomyces sp. NBC_01212]WSR05747.1 fuconate dehydratase [Streptomyces sp. NBC_01208]
MSLTVVDFEVDDIRFPTSEQLDGSDAMNPDPDYSAAYVVLRTDGTDGPGGTGEEGHGFCFTIGRGNDVMAAAIETLRSYVVGRPVPRDAADLAALYRTLTHDSQLRWLGPEKGVMHMAAGAVVNAAWDLAAKLAGKPVWQFLGEMTPEELVSLVDFRYLTDALTPQEALDILRAAEPGRAERTERLLAEGYPAYTTSPGWLGYDDDKLVRLAKEAVADGFTQIKLKVGADLDDDIRRLAVARQAVGPGIRIAVDANQRWDVADAVEWMKALAPYDPYWIEEPTSPDDVLGHAAVRAGQPVKVATGEHIANRVVFKQLLQAGAVDFVQIDAARVAGVNENLAVLLLAAKYGVPVCPHAGGVGLCELVQHLSMFDYVAVSGSREDRVIEYVDHLHEHFADPAVIEDGHYVTPRAPGFSARMLPASIAGHRYPQGHVWQARRTPEETGR